MYAARDALGDYVSILDSDTWTELPSIPYSRFSESVLRPSNITVLCRVKLEFVVSGWSWMFIDGVSW